MRSTSDPQGEWVTITETGATSNMYTGMVSLSSDAASSGSAGVCTQARVDLDTGAGSGPCDDGAAGVVHRRRRMGPGQRHRRR